MRAYVLTVSDKGSVGKRIDTAGPAVCQLLETNGYEVIQNDIVNDDKQNIINKLNWAIDNDINLVCTAGGTGFSKRDITPEATLEVIERLTPGLNELMRYESLKITPKAMLSRATSGIKNNTLIINLPGSKKAATENLQAVIPILDHGLKILIGEEGECGS